MSIYVRDKEGNRQKIAGVGLPGPAATINGVNTLTVTAGHGIDLEQSGADLTIHSLAPGRNILKNGDFRQPVNRNGKIEYTAAGITIDRWYSENSRGAFKIVDGGMEISCNASAYFLVYQALPDYFETEFTGKTMTLSMLLENNILVARTFIGPTTSSIADPDRNMYIDVNKGSSGTILARIVSLTNSNPVVIKAVKLELGAEQTLARQSESGEWELIDPPDYDLQYALCSQYSPVTGEWVGNQHSNQNLLDNWYLANPVSQRRETEYTGTGYTIDRWKAQDSNNKLKCSIVDDGIKLELPSDASVQAYWTQFLETYPSDTLTASILLQNLLGDVRLYLGSSGTLVRSDGVCSVSGRLTEASPFLRIVLQPGSSCIIQAAKLELGSVQTLAHKEGNTWVLNDPPPDPALELAKCQRYMQVYGRSINNYIVAHMHEIRNGVVSFPFQFPEMRAIPTVINNGALATRVLSNSADLSGSRYTFAARKNFLFITDTNSQVSGANAYAVGTHIEGGLLILDANL